MKCGPGTITIITVNYNTSDFIGVMLYGLHQLSSTTYPILICDNGSDAKNVLELVELQRKYPNVELIFRKQTQAGSIGHAEAVDLLAKKVNTPFFLLMDADCCILMKNWDHVMTERMGGNVKVFGTPRLLQNGDCLEDFPTVFSTLYDNNAYKELDCSFMPGPGGAKEGQDTGYLISKKFSDAGFGYRNMIAKNTRHYRKGRFGDILCAEYYLDRDCKKLFSCHFSRGSSNGKDKYKEGFLLHLPFIKKIVRHVNGKRDRERWIKRSFQIIEEASDTFQQ